MGKPVGRVSYDIAGHEERRRREMIYERALAEIRDITNFIRPCDVLLALIHRRLAKALLDAYPDEPDRAGPPRG